jgi:HD-like signal output (HDOD) protein
MATAARPAEPLPARMAAANWVLAVIDDARAGAADLAGVIATDPVLTARTLTLANSSYYGLSRRIASLEVAVAVVGFNAVRALAFTIATGLNRTGIVPDGFWYQSAVTAAAASQCAAMFDVAVGDAFVVGLLHTIGSAMLHQQHPIPALCLPSPLDPVAFCAAEVEVYGTDHARAAAHTLSGWQFPDHLCDVIACHHELPTSGATPLTRVLHMARLLADQVLQPESDTPLDPLLHASEGRLSRTGAGQVTSQIATRALALCNGLTAG